MLEHNTNKITILASRNVYNYGLLAQVAEIGRRKDLKSLGRNTVPVRLRPRHQYISLNCFEMTKIKNNISKE